MQPTSFAKFLHAAHITKNLWCTHVQFVPSYTHAQGRQRHRKSGTAHNRSAPPKVVPGGALCVCRGVKRMYFQRWGSALVASERPFWERKDLGWCGISMVGPELGRETDAIAESALLIIWSARKVVRPKPDQPDRRHRHWCCRHVLIYTAHMLKSACV